MTTEEELASLQAKLTASENRPGYDARVTAIRARIAELTPPEETEE